MLPISQPRYASRIVWRLTTLFWLSKHAYLLDKHAGLRHLVRCTTDQTHPKDHSLLFTGHFKRVTLTNICQSRISNAEPRRLWLIVYFTTSIKCPSSALHLLSTVSHNQTALETKAADYITQEHKAIMFHHAALALCLGLATFSDNAAAVDTTRDPALDANLITAATQLDRLARLSSDKNWLFDFNLEKNYMYRPVSSRYGWSTCTLLTD